MSVRKISLRSVLDIVVSLVMVAAASTLIYKNVFATPGAANTELEVPSEPVSIAGAQVRGRGDAKAVMIVYSDFQCPFTAEVGASADVAKGLNVRATPSFFIGMRLDDARVRVLRAMSGALPIGEFSEQLDGVLAGEQTRWSFLASLLGFN